ncbi:SpoIIE family protein phosphatase [Baekduia soli]|nr:SpoIIE family protein phosphatase [Baekduia soli]
MHAPADGDDRPALLGGPHLQVLLVEDDDGDAFLFEDLLQDSDLEVTVVRRRNVADAVQALSAEISCVVLDLGLPDADGLTALHRLRAAGPGVPMLVLTGLSDAARGLEAVAAGAQDYLLKGRVDGELLARSIRYAVERQRAELVHDELRAAQRDAEESARLERGLLPRPIVSDPRLQVATGSRPGRARTLLGGDFFDVVQCGDGTLHAVIGDVCGHDPDAAALGVCLRIAWRTLVLGDRPAAEVLPTLEQVLVHERLGDDAFATACMVSVAPDRRSAEVRVAGHPAPVLVDDGGARELPAPPARPMLGIGSGPGSWPAAAIALPACWDLLLYTDGLIEGRVGRGAERLGAERLVQLVGGRTPCRAARPATRSSTGWSARRWSSTAATWPTTSRSWCCRWTPMAEPAAAPVIAPSRLTRRTSGQWLGLGAGALVLAALAGLLITLLALHRLAGARTQVVDRVDPARIAAQRYLIGMVDQETAVRGYVLSGQASFLRPYRTGAADAGRARAAIAAVAATGSVDRLGADLAVVRARERVWVDGYARPVIAAVRDRGPDPASAPSVADGKARFDALRTAFGRLDADLAVLRARERARLRHAATAATVAVLIAGLLLLAAALAASATLRRVVTTPLARLAADARRVARGAFDAPVRVQGPRDIAGLSTDVDSMRRRILAELEEVQAARRRLEAQALDLQRSNAELEQFAYVASHDLQEPLRKVASFCGMLQHRYHGQLDERADQYIDFAVDGAKRMQGLINDLLAFSRVGRMAGEMRPVDMGDVAAEALSNLETAIAEAGATVVVAGDLERVPGDRSLLVALLQNLVANAVKFAGDEPPQVRISASGGEGDGVRTFAVDDNGIGIEPRYADRIFVIFQRLHPKEEYEGTGIGLAMCRKIVEFHGGRIWLEPVGALGGASFRFTLPLVQEDDA